MSSWLGGLNDSFSQLSSITGQIGGQLSNFTKEVLTETEDSDIDYEVQAKRLSEELKSTEALTIELKQENLLLRERVNKAELLISTSEREYEAKLEGKNKELDEVRLRLSCLSTEPCGRGVDSVQDTIFPSSFSTVSLNDEEDDFHDVITKQHEINKLSKELADAHMEIKEWKEKYERASTLVKETQNQNTDSQLEWKAKELENELRREADHHQQEMRTVEESHNAAVQRYQNEIRKLKQANFESINPCDSGSNKMTPLKMEMQKLQHELDAVKDQMRTRNRQLQIQKKQIEEMTTVIERKEEELKEIKEQNDSLLQEEKKWESERNEMNAKIQKSGENILGFTKVISELTSSEDNSTAFDEAKFKNRFNDFVKQYRVMSEENVKHLKELACSQQQVETLESRVTKLQEEVGNKADLQVVSPHCDSIWHNESIVGEVRGNEPLDTERFPKYLAPKHLEFGTPLGHSSPQVFKARDRQLTSASGSIIANIQSPGDLTLTLQELQKQIEDYEKEIAEYERVRAEWHAEKKSLQNLLERYGGETPAKESKVNDDRAATIEKLQQELSELQEARSALEQETNRLVMEKEQLQVATKSLEKELNVSMAEVESEKDVTESLRKEIANSVREKEQLQKAYEVLSLELNKSREDKDNLDEALDALDKQHRDEMTQVLMMRDDLKNQLKSSQGQLEKEKELKKEAASELELMEQILKEESQNYLKKINDQQDELKALGKEKQMLESKLEDVGTLMKSHEVNTTASKLYEREKLLRQNSETTESEENQQLKIQIEPHNTGTPGSTDSKLRDLEDEVKQKNVLIETLQLAKQNTETELRSEVQRLQKEVENLGTELEDAGKELAKTQIDCDVTIRKTLAENQEAMSKTVDEMQRSFELERETMKKEGDVTNKVYQQKIVHLEKLNSDLEKQLERTKNDSAEQVYEATEQNKVLVNSIQQQYDALKEQYRKLLEQHQNLKNSVRDGKNSLEGELVAVNEQKKLLQTEHADLKSLLEKSKNSENMLTAEVSELKSQLEEVNEKNRCLVETSNKAAILHSEKETRHDVRVNALLAENERLKEELANVPVIPQSDLSVQETLSKFERSDLVGLEKSDISKDDIGALLKLIKERDRAIETMQQEQMAATQSSVPSPEETKHLEEENRSLTAEKDQMLAVISEKTRENKKLKDETHKMIGIVAESKAALEKVQRENNMLVSKYEGYDEEMTKEAVSKLSRLVTEKDFEIESLKQKCATLVEVLQLQPGGSVESLSSENVQNLLKDKETLMGQVQQLLNERNELLALLNRQQVEAEQARNEVAKAVEAMERDADNNSKLQIGYSNLVHDYEQVQLKLLSVQREISVLQGKLSDLESTKATLVNMPGISGNSSSVIIAESPLKLEHGNAEFAQNQESFSKLSEEYASKSEEVELLQKDIKEKDLLIHAKTEEVNRLSKDLTVKSNEVEILRRSVENLRDQVATLTKNCDEARSEIKKYSCTLEEKDVESRAFQETNAQLSMLLREKEYENENIGEKCRRLEVMMKEHQQGKETESEKLLEELDDSKQALINARHERDQVMLSLKQKKIETDKYAEEAKNLREKESKLESELSRLRNHLIQVEEAYTQEALIAEKREAGLREQLEQAHSSQIAVREATEFSQQQAESLQEQLRAAIGQRDQAIQQLQLSQEQSVQYALALQKLQIAVERMQREEAASFAEQLDKVKSQLDQKAKDANAFEAVSIELKAKLDSANDALKSASRLNDQLELKEDNINQLKNIVSEKQLQNDDMQDKLHLLTLKIDGMVDKEILKNLVMGYFLSPNDKRQDVLRLISGVLSFSEEETQKIVSSGSHGGARAWIGGWLWKGENETQNRPNVTSSASPGKQNVKESFAQKFVKFLETESVPQQSPRLPTASMISEAQGKRRHPSSSGLSSVPTPVGTAQASRGGPAVAGRYSPYLLSSASTGELKGPVTTTAGVTINPVAITPMLPTFEPIINPKPAAEQEILQDILLNRTDR